MSVSDSDRHEEERRKGKSDQPEEEDSRRERRSDDSRRRNSDLDGKHHDEDRRRERKRRHRDHSSDESSEEGRKRRHRHKSSSSRRKKSSSSSRKRKSHKKKKRRKRSYSSSDSDSESSSDSSSSSSSSHEQSSKKTKVVNQKLMAKLHARGETLEERKERRAQKRAAKIQTQFGYTAEDNPFNDPNLHETFTWSKKKEKAGDSSGDVRKEHQQDTLEQIETIRQRRKDREVERDEMERLRAEESRMKELENYDEWAKKEEEFHLEQQRKRSAIRLVEGREKPIDILAKNLLLFGLTEEEKNHRAAVKYQERYNALDQLEKLEAELEEPYKIVKVLKLVELQELLVDIDAFRMLERDGMSGESKGSILLYWDALHVVASDEVKLLQNGGDNSAYSCKVDGIKEIFKGQVRSDLIKMKAEVEQKLKRGSQSSFDSKGESIDLNYWRSVREQLIVHLAKLDLSEFHSKMLVRQLEKLEQRKEELATQQQEASSKEKVDAKREEQAMVASVPSNVAADFGNLEEELGLTDEIDLDPGKDHSWQDRCAPRKPRYFNRVKTGYDWNKYNQTHFDSDNPPPKTVQGYKFNIFYPDLVDPTKTPQYSLEPADSDDFCIIRFRAGPPYEDLAFKIINREWNRSRKRGFRSTFERGVLSLYFNFKTHWYRR